MSEKTASTPETTPKTSKFVEKINSMKPSALSDEKRAAVVGRIKIVGVFAAGVLTTAAAVATASYYKSINDAAEAAKDELGEDDESTED